MRTEYRETILGDVVQGIYKNSALAPQLVYYELVMYDFMEYIDRRAEFFLKRDRLYRSHA